MKSEQSEVKQDRPRIPSDLGLVFENEEILTVGEAAHLLKVSEKTIYRMLRDGQITGKKIRREWRFALSRLLEWVKGD